MRRSKIVAAGLFITGLGASLMVDKTAEAVSPSCTGPLTNATNGSRSTCSNAAVEGFSSYVIIPFPNIPPRLHVQLVRVPPGSEGYRARAVGYTSSGSVVCSLQTSVVGSTALSTPCVGANKHQVDVRCVGFFCD